MRRFRPIWLLLALFPAPSLLRAQAAVSSQPAVPVTLGHSVVALTGPWKFHIGDNPQWVNPDYDDSQWETVSLAPKQGSIDPEMGYDGYVPGWTAKGHPGYAGYAWYRIRVRIAGAAGPLAILTPNNVDDAFQLFVDGRFIGSFGNFHRSPPAIYTSHTQRFLLPSDALRSSAVSPQDKTVVIAFRFYMTPGALLQPMPGGFHAPPAIGYANAIDAAYHVAMEDLFRAITAAIFPTIWFLAFAVLVLMLYLFDRTETVLLWPFWAAVLFAAVAALLVIAFATIWVTVLQLRILMGVLSDLTVGLWLMMFWTYFCLTDRKWLRNLIGILVLWEIVIYVPFQVLLTGGHASHRILLASVITSYIQNAVVLTLCAWIGWLGWHYARRGNWPLFLALLCFACFIATALLPLVHLPINFFFFGASVYFFVPCIMAMTVFLAIAFLQRFRSSQRRQQAMEEDVAQAQQVQQVLIPEDLPRVPGLAIESEYRPAREVGGDFFQIIPHPSDGSVLIVAGDVTGKGLQAGMLVALIVGAIRATVQFDADPLAVLESLNQRLCGRGNSHATCLALRIAADGFATLANAGHLPPYVNGKELPMPGALPLGMVENAEFSVMHFQLASGDTLLLLSDGVAEAQDERAQLFGFERIQALLQQPITAAEIASAAQAFGQQDDISVLRIVREPAPAEKVAAEPAFVAG